MKNHPSLIIRPQTAEEAFAYVKYLVGRMAFYREHNYTIELPNSNVFQDVLTMGSTPEDVDWMNEWDHFLSDEYDVSAFSAGMDRLNAERASIAPAWRVLDRFSEQWGFELHPEYTILLTLYGMGGSYSTEHARVIIKTNREGVFKRLVPAHTVLHEIVHIGIEHPIAHRFHLNHSEKERIVDKMCEIGLREVLHEYDVSPRGNTAMDPFLTQGAMEYLPEAVEKYIHTFPRK